MVIDYSSKQLISKILLNDRNTSRLLELVLRRHYGELTIVFNMGMYYDSIETFQKKLQKFNDALKKNGDAVILAVRGSDDNPELFKDEYFDALSNIKLVEDYSTLKLRGGHNALVVGGNLSIDKEWRVAHGKYWDGEEPIFDYTKVKSPIELGYGYDTLICSYNEQTLFTLIQSDWIDEMNPELAFKVLDMNNKMSKMVLKMILDGHELTYCMAPYNPRDRRVMNFEVASLNKIEHITFGDFGTVGF